MSTQLTKKDKAALVVTTSTELCGTYSPAKCSRLFKNVRSELAAIDSGAPSLTSLRRELGEKAVEAYLKLWLLDLNALLDLKKPLNERQIDDIAFRILDTYGSLNLADLNLVFGRALLGENGHMYDRLSIPTIMKWFSTYFDSRCDTAGERSRLAADKYRGGVIANLPRTSETRETAREAMQRANAMVGVKDAKESLNK